MTTMIDAPVLTRNQQTGPTVFRDKISDVLIEWAPKGDPTGSDFQPIPRALLNNAQFVKVVRQGIITIEDDSEEVAQAFESQSRIFTDRMAKDKDAIDRSMDDAPNRDYITETCVGPATRGVGTCESEVPVQQEHKGTVPPLCPTHQSLRNEFVLAQGDEMDADGKPVVKWIRMTLDRQALPSQEG